MHGKEVKHSDADTGNKTEVKACKPLTTIQSIMEGSQ